MVLLWLIILVRVSVKLCSNDVSWDQEPECPILCSSLGDVKPSRLLCFPSCFWGRCVCLPTYLWSISAAFLEGFAIKKKDILYIFVHIWEKSSKVWEDTRIWYSSVTYTQYKDMLPWADILVITSLETLFEMWLPSDFIDLEITSLKYIIFT